jgi:hypothetical protein
VDFGSANRGSNPLPRTMVTRFNIVAFIVCFVSFFGGILISNWTVIMVNGFTSIIFGVAVLLSFYRMYQSDEVFFRDKE